MKKILLSVAVCAAMFTACKKNNDNTSRRDMIVGSWTVGQFGYDVNNNSTLETGETAPASPTTVSGTFAFNSNGTVITNIAAFGFPSQADTAQWSLVNNDNYIRTISGGDTSLIEIKGLTSTSMTLRDTTMGVGQNAAWIILNK